jgi:uncharacterized protein YxjI
MQMLKECDKLLIQQQTSLKEAVMESFDLEKENTYIVRDSIGRQMYLATEEAEHGWLFKSFLNASRPFTISVLPSNSRHGIRITRPFRFYFHKASVALLDGKPIGSVKKRFSILRRIYTVYDSKGNERFQIMGPLLKPWTFNIMMGQRRLGVIKKNWSGLAREALTEADNFTLEFPRKLHPGYKLLLLGVVFLIDFVHFERQMSQKS